jgi:hypothetical protein
VTFRNAFASIEVCPLAGRPQRLWTQCSSIVIGLDVRKQSVTAVAVDEAVRPLAEKVVLVGSDGVSGRASRVWH